MRRLAILSFLTLLLSSPIACYKTCNLTTEVHITVTSVVESGCDGIGSDKYVCGSLQEALELLSLTVEACTVFKIQLDLGKHTITSPVSTNSSVHLYNANRDHLAIVSCSFDAEFVYNKSGELHTLYFNQSNLVRFSDLIFESCPLPIRIEQSSIVIVERSSFRYFTEAVFDIHNSIKVTIHNCSFTDNKGSGIINEPYRGNTGGLSITYNHLNRQASNALVNVSTTQFINNSVSSSMNLFSTNRAIDSGVLTGRGGGLAIFVREDKFNITSTICGCNFFQNFARFNGGGMYVLFNGSGRHTTHIANNVYESNVALMGGAGLTLIGIAGAVLNPHSFNIEKCEFIQNRAKVDGGIFYFIFIGGRKSNALHIQNTIFDRNYLFDGSESFGAALAVRTEENFNEKRSSITSVMRNCIFSHNVGNNSIISIGLQPFNLSGTNSFINNTGSVLKIVGALVTLGGTVQFINNTAPEGAAIQLHSFSQMSLADNLQLLFSGNFGSFGASILVSAATLSVAFEQLLYNPVCFLLLESDTSLPPSQWHSVGINITFTKNSALFGSAIYATSLRTCSWFSAYSGYSFDPSFFPKWPIFDIRNDNVNRALSNTYCQNGSIVTESVKIEILNTLIQAKDELGKTTGSLARLSFSSSAKESEIVELNPNTLLISREIFHANLSFHLIHYNSTVSNVKGNISIESFGIESLTSKTASTNIQFTSESCIGGFSLVAVQDGIDAMMCECDRSDESILSCEEDKDSIIMKADHWAIKSGEQSSSLFFHLCPIGYCRCFLNTSLGPGSCVNVFTNSDPDRQCTCGRKGILCGECTADSAGVTVLLNTCTSCHKESILLLPVLIIAITFVMVVIILADKPLPQWSYPLLFYTHMASLAPLQLQVSIISIGQYLLYISNAFSFYFPYDFCIYPGMTALESYGLKYIPAIIGSLVVGVLMLIRYLVSKYSFISLHHIHGHGIWTIILLVYSHTVYTSTNILNCPLIPDNTGKYAQRWYIDGSFQCFQGPHVPLTIFAILWLILLVLLVPATVTLALKKPRFIFQKSVGLKHFVTSLQEPYKHPFRFWSGVELFRRLFILFFVTTFPNNSTFVLLFIMFLIFCYGFCHPYKEKYTNVLEMSLLVLFLILLMVRVFEISQHSSQTSIPSCDGGGPTLTECSLVLLILYYTPVLVGIVCLSIWTVKKLRRFCVEAKKSKKISAIKNQLELFEFSGYHLLINRQTSTEITLQ